MTAQQLREAYHWSGYRCDQTTCPGVDECCHAEDDGTGPASVERWEAVAAQLNENAPGYFHPECGFRWQGKDGLDVPLRDGEPVCPRCEIDRVRKETIHQAWLKVHVRRFDAKHSEQAGSRHVIDSHYAGVRAAERALREMWSATGDLREIGSIDTKDVADPMYVNHDLHRTDDALAERLSTHLRAALEAAVPVDEDRRASIRRLILARLQTP